MTDTEIIVAYEDAYKREFELNFQMVNGFHEKARDKKYAVQLGLVIGGIISLSIKSELDQKIIEHDTHLFKLGGSVVDTIKNIPNIIKDFKDEKERKNKNKPKAKPTIVWKRIFGIIPYAIDHIKINSKLNFSSVLEDEITEIEIINHFARIKAITDINTQLLAKYYELGGIQDDLKMDNKLLPMEYESLSKLKEDLSNNDLVSFFNLIKSILASLPYDMKINEAYFHSNIHLMLRLLDFNIESEVETNIGRIDSVIETENYIHIFEFKFNDSTVALNQIKEKLYYQKYFAKNKKVILVGVALDRTQRNIVDWNIQSLP